MQTTVSTGNPANADLSDLTAPKSAADDKYARFECCNLESLPGFALDISRMRFDPHFFDRMRPMIDLALDRMRLLERGMKVNWTEKQQVGHYWLRAPELAPDAGTRQAIVSSLQRIHEFAARVHAGAIAPRNGGRFENILHIGIGGSALGPRLMERALGHPSQPLRAFFMDNTDPAGMDRILNSIDLARTLCLVASKSGGTKETENGMLVVTERLQTLGLQPGEHLVAITRPGSRLDKHAGAQSWHPSFPIWDWVGGRTSITSAVGLLPAALQGFAVDDFLKGARQMDVATRESNVLANPAMALALMWYAAGGGHGASDMVILPYSDRLDLLGQYLQQLVMESLGKKHDSHGNVVHQGIAVYGNKGSTDQHAYVQQLRDGLSNFFATFIGIRPEHDQVSFAGKVPVTPTGDIASGDYLHAYLLGTRIALTEAGRESMTVWLNGFNAERLGQLIALYERAVGFYASFINVNAYDQPGVEAGKKCADEVICWQRLIQKVLAEKEKQDYTPQEVAGAVNLIIEREPEKYADLRKLDFDTAFHLLKYCGL